MKVSFDFDDTLSIIEVQRYAEFLQTAGFEVWIVTSRLSNERAHNPNWNKDLEFVAKCAGIENIHYCNLQPKSKFFKDNDFLFHLDDDPEDVEDINTHTDTPAILFVPTVRMDALNQCNELIDEHYGKEM